MKSENSNNNTIEIDGICFETLFPEQNYQVPKYKEETPIQLGVRIINNSSTPYRFELPYFIPQLSNSNGTLIEMDFGRNVTIPIKESDIPFIYPAQSQELTINAQVDQNRYSGIHLRAFTSYGTVYSFRHLQLDEYNIRLQYISRSSKHQVHPGLEYREYDGFWVGEVFTPWKKIHLR